MDEFSITPPLLAADALPVSLRYSDFDSNGHVNNTSYFDFLQTALAKGGLSPKPSRLQIKFIKEILPEIESVEIKLDVRARETVFSMGRDGTIFAEGRVT